jgi:DNA modification methylase
MIMNKEKNEKFVSEPYNPQHINYALVEDTRPPMYKAMKYWGRKPHNIWNDYIEHYCPKEGVVLDPFMGSGISTFESLKVGRKIISTDLNPLSSFVVEVLSTNFNKNKFCAAVESIKTAIESDEIYKIHFRKQIDGEIVTVYNYIWLHGSVGLTRIKNSKGEGVSYDADDEDVQKANDMHSIEIPYWFPTDVFPQNPSINNNFIKNIGGNSFDKLWTRRSLYLLSKMFNLIESSEDEVKLHLMYAFVHTLHLVCKMVVPRGAAGNRDFSGSWGRADYMIRNRSMEQNPLVVFLRSCYDKQGVVKAMLDAKKTLPTKRKLNFISSTQKKLNPKADINYGVLDIADLCDYIKEDSIDFIITDPPYGGLVQYMDLSLVWLVWLQHFDERYTPDASGEITYKKNITSRDSYKRKLILAFKNMYKVLKPDHFMVVTFHNQDIKEWNDFVGAIHEAGFTFEKVTHQYNKRSGESNVANPYGTTSSDFYIRCKKATSKENDGEREELNRFVVERTKAILIERSEPTPFTFILNGLLPDMLQAGYLQPEEPAEELQKILAPETGEDRMFCVVPNFKDKAGDYYWFNRPSNYISHHNIPLKERVDTTIKALLRRKISVRYDDIVAEIFREFPNGQTPDLQGIVKVVAKYAKKSGGKWKLKDEVEHECTIHTQQILSLCKMARKAQFEPFIGRREQREYIDGHSKLSEYSAYLDLGDVLYEYDEMQLSRIEMMDCVWIKEGKISAVFEVENSTNFIDAVGRASNIDSSIPKFMVIPDRRLQELQNYKDQLFVTSFRNNAWLYLTFEELRRLGSSRSLTIDDIKAISKTL